MYRTFLFSELLNVHFLVFYFYLGIVVGNGQFLRKKERFNSKARGKQFANLVQVPWVDSECIKDREIYSGYENYKKRNIFCSRKILKTSYFYHFHIFALSRYGTVHLYKSFALHIEFLKSRFKNRYNFLTLKSSRIDIWRWRWSCLG